MFWESKIECLVMLHDMTGQTIKIFAIDHQKHAEAMLISTSRSRIILFSLLQYTKQNQRSKLVFALSF